MSTIKARSSVSVRATSLRVGAKSGDPLRGLRWAAIALILLTVGRVVDVVPILSGLPLVKIVMLCVVFALISQRKKLPPLSVAFNRSVAFAVAFAALMAISPAFSIWLGPTRDFLLQQWPVLILLVLVVLKLSGDWQSLKSLYLALVVSGMLLASLGLLSYSGGRLAVLSSYDTNELAYVLGGIIPAAMAFAMTGQSRARRLLFGGCAAIMAIAVLLTGSRGGLLGIVAIAFLAVVEPGKLRSPSVQVRRPTASEKRRGSGALARVALLLLISAVIAVASWPQLPQETRERLATLVNLEADYNLSDKPEDLGRVQIWKRGMGALAERPIGYGVGAFPKVDWEHGGRFYTAHNSLVLISVELGVIGIFLYLMIYASLWCRLRTSRCEMASIEAPSEQHREMAVFCRMAQVSMMAHLVSGFFLSTAYFYAHWVNLGLAMAVIALIVRQSDKHVRGPNSLIHR